MNQSRKSSFEEANKAPDQSLLAEFWSMIRQNKKLYLIPLLVALLAFGLLVILGGSAAAPFIYTLF